MNKIQIFLICIFLLTTSNVISQTKIDFTSNKGKTLSFKKGDRIGYILKGLPIFRSGVIKDLNDSILVVNGKQVRIENIKRIGLRKRGAGLLSFTSGFTSSFILVFFVLPAKNNSTLKYIGTATSLTIITFGLVNDWKNRLHKVSRNYTYKVF